MSTPSFNPEPLYNLYFLYNCFQDKLAYISRIQEKSEAMDALARQIRQGLERFHHYFSPLQGELHQLSEELTDLHQHAKQELWNFKEQ